MQLSYAQRLEDYYLSRAFAGRGPGTYVDIGAGHPVYDNVSYWFYLQGWSGLVVEPQADLLAAYAEMRPRDRRDGSLVGRTDGEAPFYRFETLHGLSTMKPEAAEAARRHEPDFRTERREVVTLARLLERHRLGRIDFLKIDVEGAEGDVLAGADWARWRPAIILAESVSPGASDGDWRGWDALLVARDYEFALFDGLNRYYVAREEEGLGARACRARSRHGTLSPITNGGRATFRDRRCRVRRRPRTATARATGRRSPSACRGRTTGPSA